MDCVIVMMFWEEGWLLRNIVHGSQVQQHYRLLWRRWIKLWDEREKARGLINSEARNLIYSFIKGLTMTALYTEIIEWLLLLFVTIGTKVEQGKLILREAVGEISMALCGPFSNLVDFLQKLFLLFLLLSLSSLTIIKALSLLFQYKVLQLLVSCFTMC